MTSIVLNLNHSFYIVGSAALSTKSVKPRTEPAIANMSYILKVGNQNISVPLNKPVQLWAKKEFDPKLPLVMMVTGWTTNFNDTTNNALDVIYAAYRCRGNVNFVVSGSLFMGKTLFQSTF